MATNLSGVLAGVPGLAGYLAKQQLDQQQEAGQVQQLGALAQLQAQMQNQQVQAQNRQRQESARQALTSLGPDATEEQKVNALLPHIGDPDKIAGVLQNAALKKSQQEQTKQIALSRLAQQASQHMQDLQVRQQNARTAEERSHWERQAANVRLGFQRQAAEIQAGRFTYDTGIIAPQITPYAAPTGPVAAPAVQPGPTPAPAPGPAPSPAPAASPAGFPRQGPNEGREAQLRAIQGEIATEEQLALENKDNPQQAEVHRLNAERLRSELSKLGPAPANNLDARDLRLAGSPQPQATTQPSTQPAPQAAPAQQVPDWIKAIPEPRRRVQEEAAWRKRQELLATKPDATKTAMEKAAFNAGLREIQKDEQSLASAAQLETALKRWQELNSQVETGRVVGMRPAIAQPLLQEMQQLQSYLAVNNFKPGQGQISNFERQLIKGAGPTVTNDKPTNENIVRIQLGAVQNARERAMFREAYLEKNKSLIGADRVWNEYIEKNPRFKTDAKGNVVENANRPSWETLLGATSQPAGDGWVVREKK